MATEPFANHWPQVGSQAEFDLMVAAAEITNQRAGDHVGHYTVRKCDVRFPIVNKGYVGYEVVCEPPDILYGTQPLMDEFYYLQAVSEAEAVGRPVPPYHPERRLGVHRPASLQSSEPAPQANQSLPESLASEELERTLLAEAQENTRQYFSRHQKKS